MPPLLADTDEGTFGDECLSKVGTEGPTVVGPNKVCVGVDVGDESAGDVRGVMKDTTPNFGRKQIAREAASETCCWFHVEVQRRYQARSSHAQASIK